MNNNFLVKNTTFYSRIKDTTKYDILVSRGKIKRIAPSGEIPDPGHSIDAKGNIVIPGMIDIHIHGAGGSDSLDGTREDLKTISRTLAGLGTTSFLSTMVVFPGNENRHVHVAGELTGKDLGGAQLLGVYIEGPFISIDRKGGISPRCITEPSAIILEKIIEEAEGSLKMMCIAPEIPGNERIIEKLIKNGIIAAFGHSDAGYEETKNGISWGISHATHLFNTMRSLHHREPGPLAAIFENPGVSIELISDSYHIHPAMINLATRLAGKERIACISDGISGTGLPDGTYRYNNRDYISKSGVAKYTDGTFIGSTMGLKNIAKNYMMFTGCSLSDAIDTVTLNPARILGIDNRKGTLEEGKDADIVVMDPDFNIKHSIIAGKLVFSN